MDKTEQVGQSMVEENYKLNENINMFTLSWINVKSALVYGLLSALVAVGIYAISIGDVFALNVHAIVNAFVFGFLGVFVSLIKNLLTDASGKFLGVTTIIPPTN